MRPTRVPIRRDANCESGDRWTYLSGVEWHIAAHVDGSQRRNPRPGGPELCWSRGYLSSKRRLTTSERARLACFAPWRVRTKAIFGAATRIGSQRSGSAGADQMSLIAERKRRNLFRVGVAYAIVAWLLLGVASAVRPFAR